MTVHPAAAAPVVVPIRSLGPRHRDRIAVHLKALDERDRYLRFGYAARDEHIDQYVGTIDFGRDDIFGIYNRKLELIAVAHLAYPRDPGMRACAEFGVSVLHKGRGRGFGQRLFERAVIHARNEGVDMLFVHALSENGAMVHIARKGGAIVEHVGGEADAYLKLPPATLDSRLAELVAEQVAQTDYRLKRQAQRFRDFLAGIRERRDGARDGRRPPGS